MYNFIKKVMFSALIIGSMVCTTIRPAMLMMPSVDSSLRVVQVVLGSIGSLLIGYSLVQADQHATKWPKPKILRGRIDPYGHYGRKSQDFKKNEVIKPAVLGGGCLFSSVGIVVYRNLSNDEKEKNRVDATQTAIDLKTK